MMIFFLAVLVPAFVFFICAFVNFQRELLLVKREKRAGAKTIPLDLPRTQASETSGERSTVVPIEPESERGNAGPLSHDWRTARITAVKGRPPKEFYQLESAYAGPLFVVPLREEDVAPDAIAAHSRLVSAMYARHV
jgi:hypothetical protein